MAERAVFLDRDNTIIEDREGYIGDPARVRLLPGAATAIASMRRLGYRIIIVSNQSGVARGMFDEAAVESVNQEMCRQLRDQGGAHVDASYYCPYHPDGTVPEYKMDHDWRKPKPGMLKQAAEDFSLDLHQCWMIGDSSRDIECGLAANCRTILLKDPAHAPSSEEVGALASPHFIVKTLADAARVIAREGRAIHREAAKPAETPPAALAVTPIHETPAPEASPVAGLADAKIPEETKKEPDPEPIISAAVAKTDPVSEAISPSTATQTTEAQPDPGVTEPEKSALSAPIASETTPEELPAEKPAEKPTQETAPAEPDPAQLIGHRARPQPHPALMAASETTAPAPRHEETKTSSNDHVHHDHLKPVVDEILSVMRQRQRAQDMPEFTRNKFIAILAQISVVICVIMAAWDAIMTIPYVPAQWYPQVLTLLRGILWMLGAVTLQILVFTLNQNQRQK